MIVTAFEIMVSQWSLIIVKAFVVAEMPCRTVTMNCHYLDIATTFINFNSFVNSSKTHSVHIKNKIKSEIFNDN